MWIANLRINGQIKTVEITAETEWNARKIAFTLCKGLRLKKKSALLVSLEPKEALENG